MAEKNTSFFMGRIKGVKKIFHLDYIMSIPKRIVILRLAVSRKRMMRREIW